MAASEQVLAYKPKYVLIADLVREQILSGKLRPDDRLLSDEILAAKYNFNKRTVAAGLQELVQEGFLERIERKGTFVRGIPWKENDTGVSSAVGMIMVSEGDVYSNITRFIGDALSRLKLYPALINSDVIYQDANVVSFLKSLADERMPPYGLIIDGDLLLPFDYLCQNSSQFKNLVFIIKYHHHRRIKEAKYALVDFYEAGKMAAEHFIACGHRNIAFPANHEVHYAGPWSSMQVMLLEGFAEVCRQSCISFDEELFWKLLHGAPFADTMQEVMLSERPPDAIFMYHDSLVEQKLLPVLEHTSMRPHVDIISFYNTPWAVENNFSSFSINEAKIAEAAVDLLTNGQEGEEMLIKPKLILRG